MLAREMESAVESGVRVGAEGVRIGGGPLAADLQREGRAGRSRVIGRAGATVVGGRGRGDAGEEERGWRRRQTGEPQWRAEWRGLTVAEEGEGEGDGEDDELGASGTLVNHSEFVFVGPSGGAGARREPHVPLRASSHMVFSGPTAGSMSLAGARAQPRSPKETGPVSSFLPESDQDFSSLTAAEELDAALVDFVERGRWRPPK